MHAARDQRIDEARRAGEMLSKDEAARLDEAVFAADRAVYDLRQNQRERLNGMTPAQWDAEKKRWLDEQDRSDSERRQRRQRGLP